MGYRSDVGLALRAELVPAIEKDKHKKLLELADRHANEYGDILYVWQSIKWYEETDPEIREFMADVIALPDSGYLLVEVGETADHIGCFGKWSDNPFWMGCRSFLAYNVP